MSHPFIIYLCIFVCTTLRSISADDSQKNCPGPSAFYDGIGCTPITNTIVDGCANQYDCDKVKSLPLDTCFINGKFYDTGEKLKDEDANPCDIGYTCTTSESGVAQFNCAVVDCFQGPPKPECYRKNSPLQCCPGEEVCPEDPEDRATCDVNGKTYADGEYFTVESEPDLNCVCQPEYEGKNFEPFCARPKHPYCSPFFWHRDSVTNNCSPVYYESQSPQTSCSVFDRCQNDQDKVIKSNKTIDSQKSVVACSFVSLALQYGDELNRDTDYSSVCVKCICEVGPTPTCQRLPESVCDPRNVTIMDRIQDEITSTIKKIKNQFSKTKDKGKEGKGC